MGSPPATRLLPRSLRVGQRPLSVLLEQDGRESLLPSRIPEAGLPPSFLFLQRMTNLPLALPVRRALPVQIASKVRFRACSSVG